MARRCSGSKAKLGNVTSLVIFALMRFAVWRELDQDRLVLDLAVFDQKKGFAEDERERAVSLKRKWQTAGRGLGRRAFNDAKIAATRLHQYISAAQVNPVLSPIAPHNQGI